MMPEIDENGLCEILEKFIGNAEKTICSFLDNEDIQEAVDCIEQIGESAADVVGAIKFIRRVASIPSNLFLNKFVRYCKGLTDIPLEKRQKYLRDLGKEKFNKEGAFTLNVIQKIEEEDKIPLLLKLLKAKMDHIIDDVEYRRLMILTDRTLYSDLLYLEGHITADPVALISESDYGLAASGLLVTAGNVFIDEVSPEDNGLRFNYTLAAKKLAYIFFEVRCDFKPTNIGFITMASNDDVHGMLDEVFSH